MKNKKMLYILIPGALIVWGLIIAKIVGNMHSDESRVVSQGSAMTTTEEALSDTFSIHPIYRDPFLGKVQTVYNNTGPVTPKVISTPVVKAMTPWPSIVYSGIIKNQKLKKELVLLEISGQSHTMKIGETIDGILLSKAYQDSVEVQFFKEKKF